MSRNKRQADPKPFDFVPFPANLQRQSTKGHEIYDAKTFSGKLGYRLVALTPIHIASGTYALSPEETNVGESGIVRDCYRVNDQPTIPGSSLKGVIRSVVEAVSASCITTTRVKISLLPGGKKLTEGCKPERACPACSMFGRLDRLGKISFSDALLEPGQNTEPYHLPSLYGPHPDSPVYLDKKGHYKGRKFYYHGRPAQDPRKPVIEVIPEKGKLSGHIDFINLTMEEMGLLFFALGLDKTFRLKLGGGKPVCLGSFQILPQELSFWDKNDWIDYDGQAGEQYQDKPLEGLIQVFIEKTGSIKGYLIPKQMKALRRILRYPHDRDCPSGNY